MRHPTFRLATVIAAAALLLLPATVLADAELDFAIPADSTTVEGPPPVIEATYTEALDPDGSSLRLLDPSEAVLAEGGVVADDGARMVISPVPELAPGEYEVRWTTRSIADTHVERGSWTFTVTAAPTPVPTPTEAPPAPPSAEPSAPPDPTPEPTDAPTPSPSGDGEPAASEGDVILPIIAALAMVGIAGVVLLRRRGPASRT